MLLNNMITTNTTKLDLCPICKNGQTCDDLIGHAKNWSTTN